ncbi:alpha/beta hydrolase family esterase [Paracoccus fontiphilus]|uniref:Alpha/beta hydrolase family esterase n=1 Tax=Paracoccus fontiphilus TaxID=1815556 RepID=A0ABV7IEU9_9RHOB|nr:PHB depolymerase family esterase [Paracoccus fontiphilus]
MKDFTMEALRRAMAGLHRDGAHDLVQRTLARHGLAGPATDGLQMPFSAQGSAEAPKVPAGASFAADRFSCAAGSRDYMLYVPASAGQGLKGMIMMLHGCTQTHADFARGTGMNDLAEAHGLLVVYPQQARGENAQSCWNWFNPGDQRRGRGEPEILAQMARNLADAHAVPRNRIFVAGLSAGAAMAVILGQTHPDIFAAVGVHSGLPFGSARDVPGAFAAMNGTGAPQAGPRSAASPNPAPTPTIIFHGSADKTVHPVNGERIAADVLAAGPVQTLLDRRSGKAGSRRFQQETTTTGDGRLVLEHWVIDGLGHAWSGGRPGGSYADPLGPDASAEMARFFLAQAGTAGTDGRP